MTGLTAPDIVQNNHSELYRVSSLPWQKKFKIEEALECALQEFWQKGFKNASIANICDAIPASRYGLYDEFDGKSGLYHSSIDHYQEHFVDKALAPLETPQANLTQLFAYRDAVLSTLDEMPKACFMCIAAMEMSSQDAEVAARVNRHFNRQIKAFTNCLKNDANSLSASPEALAQMLALSLQGLSLSLVAKVEIKIIRDGIRLAFDSVIPPLDRN